MGWFYRAGLLIGRVTGQRDKILEWVLRAEVRGVPDGRVLKVGGGSLGENGTAREVQRRGGMWTPRETWKTQWYYALFPGSICWQPIWCFYFFLVLFSPWLLYEKEKHVHLLTYLLLCSTEERSHTSLNDIRVSKQWQNCHFLWIIPVRINTCGLQLWNKQYLALYLK